MTKQQQLAYNFGQRAAKEGIQKAPCYDSNMHHLVSESRTLSGSNRNVSNMTAWIKGYESVIGVANA